MLQQLLEKSDLKGWISKCSDGRLDAAVNRDSVLVNIPLARLLCYNELSDSIHGNVESMTNACVVYITCNGPVDLHE
ncbi:hypothetical protein [Cohnella boryungensis]|uniref:Uncharacterized protein n=1 Tax=Cohnella boryungensis TaxID=768479 RepID=A0ABV8SAW6_9BACL